MSTRVISRTVPANLNALEGLYASVQTTIDNAARLIERLETANDAIVQRLAVLRAEQRVATMTALRLLDRA